MTAPPPLVAPVVAPLVDPLVDMANISKSFGGVLACDDVDFDVLPGEVHALLGENGAGKSTLMNILSGAMTDYSGTIALSGKRVHLSSPAGAQDAGIAIIHQELDLVPELSVGENMYLGRERTTRWRTYNRRETTNQAREGLREVGIDIDPRARVSALRVGEQQLVAIAKALSLHARVLIMDEPTSALAESDAQRLFTVVRNLRERGVGIVYISHRLEEIDALADRVTVLRNGKRVATVDPHETPQHQIIEMMVGRLIQDIFGTTVGEDTAVASDTSVLAVDGLTVRARVPRAGRTEPVGVSLQVRRGEIVGLAGLLGSGRTELLETLFGVGSKGAHDGTVTVDGKAVAFRTPRKALDAGVCLVPEDRAAAGLFKQHSVAANIVLTALPSVSRGGVVRRTRAHTAVSDSVRRLKIKCSSTRLLVDALSGGNQQKVVFGRQLLVEPKLLLLDDPTRGVDIGAKAEIYQVLRSLAAEGMGILLASSELPELIGICDRVVVLRRGQVVTEAAAADLTEADILAAAMGTADQEVAT